MNKFFESISKTMSKKQFKYGGYAFLITLAGIAVIVLLNIGLTVLEDNFDLRVDMSQNKKYTLTDQSKKVVTDLQKDVYIYTLFTPGKEDSQVEELLRKYKGVSGHIITENHDPEKEPRFMQQFAKEGQEDIAAGSIIVSDADKKFFQVLTQTPDIYQYEYNNESDPYTPSGVQIVAEDSITQAINYISTGFMPTVYVVEGHGELKISDIVNGQSYLERSNFQVETINLSTTDKQIKAGDLVMFLSPISDITDAERDMLKPLVEKGGRFFFLFDPVKLGAKKLPNLESLLKLYDVSLKPGLVYEQNIAYLASQTPLLIAPMPSSHAITSALSGTRLPVYLYNCGAIEVPDVAPENSITITPLYTSSSDSYLKEQLTEDYEKADTDESGPFNLAIAIEKTNGGVDADKAQMVIVYSTEFLTNSIFADSSSNTNFMLVSAAWMRNAESDIYIRGKTVSSPVLGFRSTAEQIVVIVLSCLLVPVLLLVAGIVVYIRRKHL